LMLVFPSPPLSFAFTLTFEYTSVSIHSYIDCELVTSLWLTYTSNYYVFTYLSHTSSPGLASLPFAASIPSPILTPKLQKIPHHVRKPPPIHLRGYLSFISLLLCKDACISRDCMINYKFYHVLLVRITAIAFSAPNLIILLNVPLIAPRTAK